MKAILAVGKFLQNISDRSYFIISLALLVIFSAFSVFRFAPEFISSDIMMNSIMSLRHVTLFYWGQNRILNVLPALLWPVRDPAANLWLVLFTSALSFFGVLLASSYVIAKLTTKRNIDGLCLFAISSAFAVLVFDKGGIAGMAIGHVEYSLPALLVVICIGLLRLSNIRFLVLILLLFVFFVLALGMNPSVILAIVFLVAAFAWTEKRIRLKDVVAILLAVAVFAGWTEIAGHFANRSYGSFDVSIIPDGTRHFILNLLERVHLVALLVILIAMAAYRVLAPRRPEAASNFLPLFIVFSAAWILFFSGNTWVVANKFHWRYLTLPVFAAIVLMAFFAWQAIMARSAVPKLAITLIAAGVAIFQIYAPPKSLADYPVVPSVGFRQARK